MPSSYTSNNGIERPATSSGGATAKNDTITAPFFAIHNHISTNTATGVQRQTMISFVE